MARESDKEARTDFERKNAGAMQALLDLFTAQGWLFKHRPTAARRMIEAVAPHLHADCEMQTIARRPLAANDVAPTPLAPEEDDAANLQEDLERVQAGIHVGAARISEGDLDEAKRELSFAGGVLQEVLTGTEPTATQGGDADEKGQTRGDRAQVQPRLSDVAEGEPVEDDGLALSDAAEVLAKRLWEEEADRIDEDNERAVLPVAHEAAERWGELGGGEQDDEIARAARHLAALPRNPVSQDQLGELEADFEALEIRCEERASLRAHERKFENEADLREAATNARAVLRRIREGRSDG